MKRIATLMMFVCGLSAAYSQTISLDKKDYDKMLFDNSNLQNEERELRDSIETIIKNYDKKISILDSKISKLDKDLVDANKKIADLDKDKVKAERDNLQQQVNALQADTDTLRQQLVEKDKQIAAAKIEGDQKANEQYKTGRQNVLLQIERSYQGNFDDLIKSATRQSIERDLPFMEAETTKQKIQDLQKYFEAKQVLFEQYNEQRIKSAQTKVNSLEQTELVNNLTEKLGKYKLCNDGLKDVIKEICEKNRTFIANDSYSQDTKKADISSIISRYFYDYPSFSFTDYPYLSDIVLDIMKRIQKDANTDISDLLRKL